MLFVARRCGAFRDKAGAVCDAAAGKHPVRGANQPNAVTHGDRKSQQKVHEKFGLDGKERFRISD